MSTPPLVITVDLAARLYDLDATDERVAFCVGQAIRDATTDVESYLGRPVTPLQVTETGVRPLYDGWDVSGDPIISVDQVTAELVDGVSVGTYTVTYTWGLDATWSTNHLELEPIRRWIRAAVGVHPLLLPLIPAATRRVVKAVSADGQTITYETRPVEGRGAPTGGVPPLSTLDRWRRAGRRVYTRPGDPCRRWY